MQDEDDGVAVVRGDLDPWPSKDRLAEIFRADGYFVDEGVYAVRLRDFSRFDFAQMGGDLGPGCIVADGDTGQELAEFARRVSETLAGAGVKHRMEVYSESDDLVATFHFNWPEFE